MTRFILRTVLTTLALVILFAGSFNLNRTGAQDEIGIEAAGGASKCMEINGCPGGPIFCGTLTLPDGTYAECGKT